MNLRPAIYTPWPAVAPWRRRLRPLLLSTFAFLLSTFLALPSASAFEWQNSGIWDSDSVDRAFDSGPSWFTAGPSWMMNALPGSHFRARVLDRSGDVQESTAETPYVGTLRDAFDVNLFSNVSSFATASGSSKTSRPFVPDATLATDQTWKNSAGNTNFNDGASWISGTPPGAGDRAIFATTGGSAAINAQPNLTASVSIANLQFSQTTTSGYDLTSNSTSISLTLTSIATAGGTQAISASNTSGTNTIDAPIILGGGAGSTQTFSITSGGTFVINGVISESGAGTKISKTGGGTLTLFGNNSYTGGTSIAASGGTIAIGSDTALGTGTLTFATGTALQSADANARTISNVWAIGTTQTFGSATTGDLTLSNTASISLGSTAKTFTINNNNTTLAATFTSTGGITKNGAGRLFLTGASTYTATGAPTTIDAGTLNAAIIANGGTASSIGQSSNVAARLVFGGGSLQYTGSTAASTDRLFTIGDANGDTATVDASGGTVGTLSFTSGGAIAFGNTNAHTLTLTGSNTGNNTFSPTIGDNTGATSLIKSGGGTWVLSGANTYTGGTTVSNGLLQLNSSSALGSVNGSLQVDGVLNLNGNNASVGNLSGSSTGRIWNNGPSNAVTFTIGSGNNGGGTYAGLIQDNNGAGSGTLAVTKTGTGTIALSGANTYSGGTLVNGGGTLLVVNTSGSGTGTGSVNVSASGTTLAGGTTNGTGGITGAVNVN